MTQRRSAARDRDYRERGAEASVARQATEIVAPALSDAELVAAAEAERVAKEGRRDH
jgi:hypothetical protein